MNARCKAIFRGMKVRGGETAQPPPLPTPAPSSLARRDDRAGHQTQAAHPFAAASNARERRRQACELSRLFLDLVFVVAIAQLAHERVIDHSLHGFAVFAALYLPVFLAWQGFSFYADRFDTDDVVFRLVMFAAMLAIAALAIQIPDVAHGDSSTGFAVAYIVLRSLMVGLSGGRTSAPVAR